MATIMNSSSRLGRRVIPRRRHHSVALSATRSRAMRMLGTAPGHDVAAAQRIHTKHDAGCASSSIERLRSRTKLPTSTPQRARTISLHATLPRNRFIDTSNTLTRNRSITAAMEIPMQTHVPMMMATSGSSFATSSNSGDHDHMMGSSLPKLSSFPSGCSFYSTMAASSSLSTHADGTDGSKLILPAPNPAIAIATTPSVSTLSAITRNSSTATASNKDSIPKGGDTAMDDEYDEMTSAGETYTYGSPYRLESYGTFGHLGNTATTQLPRGVLNPAFVRYNTYGKLNDERDNVLVICHALTGNASLEAWWGDLLGPGKAFDTDQYFIVCCNILGSCYGSVGPSSSRPGYDEDGKDGDIPANIPRDKAGKPVYGMDFPDISVRDTVRLQLLLLKEELKINSIKCVIGGSFGGMQAMEYCVMAGATRPVGTVGGGVGGGRTTVAASALGGTIAGKDGALAYGIGEFVTKRNGRIEPFVRSAVPIACGAAHTAWQIGISETQRQAIYADPKWNGGRYDPNDPPNSGLSVARQVAMVSYRTPLGYHKKFGRALIDESGPAYGSRAPWQVKSYLEYQGRKFLDRFDPVTYVKLTEQMDSHDIGRGRGTIEQVLSHVEIPVCVLGIDSDVLYPLREQEEMVQCMPNAELKIIHSDAGHDGFLLEQDQVAAHIKSFLYTHE